MSLPPDALPTILSRTAIERSEPPLLLTSASSAVSPLAFKSLPPLDCTRAERALPLKRMSEPPEASTSKVVDRHVDDEIAAAGRDELAACRSRKHPRS